MLQEERGGGRQEKWGQEKFKYIYIYFKMGQITACVDADKDGTVKEKLTLLEKTRTAGTVSLDCPNRAEVSHF